MEKSTSSANRQVLKRILAQEGNNRCADCKTAPHPRWASWNIGVLICIRCSGVHRSLGTHISKVRSIDLDTWNDVQLEKLVEFGNLRANAYWEAKLPKNYVPDEGKIPSFIKTKYELRRWVADEEPPKVAAVPPQIPPKVRADVPPQGQQLGQQPRQQQQSAPVRSSADLLGPLFQPQSQTSASSTPATAQPPARKDRTDVKKSILSLYSQPKPSPQRATPAASSTQRAPPPFPGSTSLSGGSLSGGSLNSLSGTSLSSLSGTSSAQQTPFQTPFQSASPSRSETPSQGIPPLDEDFSIVWK